MNDTPKPYWVFAIYCQGAAYRISASYDDVPIGRIKRATWVLWGNLLQFMFGWWRWK